MNSYHLTKQGTGWVLKPAGSNTIVLQAETKHLLETQLSYFFKLRNEVASVRIHDEWGKFQEERTYPKAADPFPPRG